MNDYRDIELGERLQTITEPEHGPTYWNQLRARVSQESAEERLRPSFGARLRRVGTSRRISFALATAAVAIAAAAVVLFGLPAVTDTTGPQPVSATEVLQQSLRALSSARTMQAVAVLQYAEWDMWDGTYTHTTERYRVFSLADGSYRQESTSRKPAGSGTSSGTRRVPDEILTYDARSGVVREYERDRGVVITTGSPVGSPDAVPGSGPAGHIIGVDLSAAARAVQAVGAARLSTTSYEGRALWVVTCSAGSAPSRPNVTEEWPTYVMTIDQETCLPVGLKWIESGVVQLNFRLERMLVNVPIERSTFRLSTPPGARVKRADAGFRRMGLGEIEGSAGYAPLVPGSLPSGYSLARTAFATRSTTVNGYVTGDDVVVLQYARGFDALTITTRKVADPAFAATTDPFDYESKWSELVRTNVELTAGAFAGTTAQVMILPRSTTPHLWAVKDGRLLTIAGGATQKELIAIADSLAPYDARDATPSAP
jgi:hypothetical protein